MPKRNYQFEKRQKDLAKKQKQEEKAQRKLDRAQNPTDESETDGTTAGDAGSDESGMSEPGPDGTPDR